MEFNDVRAFVSVVDKGSVSAAALDLHITQSAVTKRLQRLESSLGATLFDRTQRPAVLTTAGQRALEKCRRLLIDVNELRAAVSNEHAALADVRVGIAHALGEIVLTEPIRVVREAFPRVGFRLTTGWSLDLLEHVRTGALDAAIILLPGTEMVPSEVLGTSVGKERLVILGPLNLKGRRARYVRELEGAQWILNPQGCGARAVLRRALARSDINLVVAIESYNYDMQLLLTSQGQGLTLVPERIFQSSPLRSRLQVLKVTGLHFPFTIWSVHRLSAELEPLVSKLNVLVAAALAQRPRTRRW
jgi:DNA-binding transcriptional LysR family regulator